MFPPTLVQFWQHYRVPIILGVTSVVFIIVSVTILLKSVQTNTPITFSTDEASGSGQAAGIVVDIAGAVVHPGVYRLAAGSRVEDAIAAAGGLSGGVDNDRLAQAVNRAAKLSDGAKLYIPKIGDAVKSHIISSPDSANLVSVNAASQQEFEALPGIGPVTARKIIAGRPYTSVEELVAKKVMGQSLFEKLRDQLSL